MQARIQNTSCIITERARNRLKLSTTTSTKVLQSDALESLLFCLSGSWQAGSHGQTVLWPSLRCGRLTCPLPCTAKPPRAELAYGLFLYLAPFLVSGSSGACCECPAPTKAASPLCWLPGKAQLASDSTTVRDLGVLYFCAIFHLVRF